MSPHDFHVVPMCFYRVEVAGSVVVPSALGSHVAPLQTEMEQATWLAVSAFRRAPQPCLTFNRRALHASFARPSAYAPAAGAAPMGPTQAPLPIDAAMRGGGDERVVLRVPSSNAYHADGNPSLVLALFDDVAVSRRSDPQRTFRGGAPLARAASSQRPASSPRATAVAAAGDSASTPPPPTTAKPLDAAAELRRWSACHAVHGGVIRVSLVDPTTHTATPPPASQCAAGGGNMSFAASMSISAASVSQQLQHRSASPGAGGALAAPLVQSHFDSSRTPDAVALAPYEGFELIADFGSERVVSCRNGDVLQWRAAFALVAVVRDEQQQQSQQAEHNIHSNIDNTNSNDKQPRGGEATSSSARIARRRFDVTDPETGTVLAHVAVSQSQVEIELAPDPAAPPMAPRTVESLLQCVCFRTSRSPRWETRRFAVTTKLAWCAVDSAAAAAAAGARLASCAWSSASPPRAPLSPFVDASARSMWCAVTTQTVTLALAPSPFVVAESAAALAARRSGGAVAAADGAARSDAEHRPHAAAAGRSAKIWTQVSTDFDATGDTLRLADCGILLSAAASLPSVPLPAGTQPPPDGLVFARGNAFVVELDARAGVCFAGDGFAVRAKDAALGKFGAKLSAGAFTDLAASLFAPAECRDDAEGAIAWLLERVRLRLAHAVEDGTAAQEAARAQRALDEAWMRGRAERYTRRSKGATADGNDERGESDVESDSDDGRSDDGNDAIGTSWTSQRVRSISAFRGRPDVAKIDLHG